MTDQTEHALSIYSSFPQAVLYIQIQTSSHRLDHAVFTVEKNLPISRLPCVVQGSAAIICISPGRLTKRNTFLLPTSKSSPIYVSDRSRAVTSDMFLISFEA